MKSVLVLSPCKNAAKFRIWQGITVFNRSTTAFDFGENRP